MQIEHLILQKELRSELKRPIGKLISGTIEQTTPVLIEELQNTSAPFVVAVGDVISTILLEKDNLPDLIITDGYTKRMKIENEVRHPYYIPQRSKCPAAEINRETWEMLRYIIQSNLQQGQKVHLHIDGEEDLLVLPLIMELPLKSIIVYGQPNEGVVIRKVSHEAKLQTKNFLLRMEKRLN